MNIILPILHSTTLKELIEHIDNLLTEEFQCGRWDLIRFLPERKKYVLIHSSIKDGLPDSKKEKFKLSEATVNDLSADNTIRFKKLVFSSHLSDYERILATHYKWQLIFFIKNPAQQIIGALFIFYPSGKHDNSYIEKLETYKETLSIAIHNCFNAADYQKNKPVYFQCKVQGFL